LRKIISQVIEGSRRKEKGSKALEEARREVMDDKFSTDFILEERDLEEYGNEVYDEIYDKSTAKMIAQFDKSVRLVHFRENDTSMLAVSLVQCLIEVQCLQRFMINVEISKDSVVTDLLKKTCSRAFTSEEFPGLKSHNNDISGLTKLLKFK